MVRWVYLLLWALLLFCRRKHETAAFATTWTFKRAFCQAKCSPRRRGVKVALTSLSAKPSLGKPRGFRWFRSREEGKESGSHEDETETLDGVMKVVDTLSAYQANQQHAEKANSVLEELSNIRLEGTSADGKVRVVYDGQQKPVGSHFDEQYVRSLNPETAAEELSASVTEAMQDAHSKSVQRMEEKLKPMYSDLGFES